MRSSAIAWKRRRECSGRAFSNEAFELGEELFDRIEAQGIFRHEYEARAAATVVENLRT
jgi:hypothetical protein